MVGAQFSISNFENSYTIKVLKFRWVASQGEDLQFFPISFTVPIDCYGCPTIFDIPFDYPSLVQWSAGTFEVGITSVVSAFKLSTDLLNNGIDMTIAKWNDGASAYRYSGDSIFVLAQSALFGTHCPFTTVNDVNVVKMVGSGYRGTSMRLYLIFHKVLTAGPVKSGFAVVRTH